MESLNHPLPPLHKQSRREIFLFTTYNLHYRLFESNLSFIFPLNLRPIPPILIPRTSIWPNQEFHTYVFHFPRSQPRVRPVQDGGRVGAENGSLVQDAVSGKSTLLHGALDKRSPSGSPVRASHENVAVALLKLGEVLSEVTSRIPGGASLSIRVGDPVVEKDLLDLHGVESLKGAFKPLGLFNWVKDASVVTGERGDASRLAAGAETVAVDIKEFAGPGASSESAKIALDLSVDLGEVVDLANPDGLLAERREGGVEVDSGEDGDRDGVDDAPGTVDLASGGREGDNAFSIADGLDGGLERVLETKPDGIIEDMTGERGLALTDLVKSPDLFEDLGVVALQGVATEHLEETDVLDRTAGAVGDE